MMCSRPEPFPPPLMSILDFRIVALVVTAVAVAHGTYYSLQNSTYLDTSDPHLASQPHPLATTHTLASKRSLLNVVFLKWSWAWTTVAFLPLLLTSPIKRARRLLQWAFASVAWFILTSWFFGPSLFTRLTVASGGECGLHIEKAFVPIPQTYCSTSIPVARSTHPELFPVVFEGTEQSNGPLIPRLRRGHDISGHVFLLTLCVLFLADQLRQTRTSAHHYAIVASGVLSLLWVFSLWVTSVFFHTPSEKISGFSASPPHHIPSQSLTPTFRSSRNRMLSLFSDSVVVLSQDQKHNSHTTLKLISSLYNIVPYVRIFCHVYLNPHAHQLLPRILSQKRQSGEASGVEKRRRCCYFEVLKVCMCTSAPCTRSKPRSPVTSMVLYDAAITDE